jgi:methionyl-tRNA formyltransferase
LFFGPVGGQRRLFVACAGGGWVEVEMLQLEGGKAMSGTAFVNGLRVGAAAGAGFRDTGARCT